MAVIPAIKSATRGAIKGPSHWTPDQEESLYHWIDMSDTNTISPASAINGGNVSNVSNKASGPNYEQVSGANQPAYDPSDMGLEFVRSEGDNMLASGPLTSSDKEHLVAMVLTTDAASNARVWNNTDFAGSRNFVDVITTGPKLGYMCKGNFSQPNGTSYTADQRVIFIGTYNGTDAGTSKINRNTEVAEVGDDLTAANHTLGSRVTTNDNFNGKMYEFLIFTDTSDRLKDNVIQYLLNKWGVEV